MSKIHVLGSPNPNQPNSIEMAVHFTPVATGQPTNNSVGVPWKTAYLASLGSAAPTSRLLSTGNNSPAPGKITSGELSQIVAGDLIERIVQAGLEPEDVANPDPALNRQADEAISTFRKNFATQYQYYGYTVA